MLGAPVKKEEPVPVNPSAARTEKSLPSAPTSKKPSRATEGTAKRAEERSSVREELRAIQAQRRQKEATTPKRPEPERTKKTAQKALQHKQPPRKKKKVKER